MVTCCCNYLGLVYLGGCAGVGFAPDVVRGVLAVLLSLVRHVGRTLIETVASSINLVGADGVAALVVLVDPHDEGDEAAEAEEAADGEEGDDGERDQDGAEEEQHGRRQQQRDGRAGEREPRQREDGAHGHQDGHQA